MLQTVVDTVAALLAIAAENRATNRNDAELGYEDMAKKIGPNANPYP